jgi:hypothetical protein
MVMTYTCSDPEADRYAPVTRSTWPATSPPRRSSSPRAPRYRPRSPLRASSRYGRQGLTDRSGMTRGLRPAESLRESCDGDRSRQVNRFISYARCVASPVAQVESMVGHDLVMTGKAFEVLSRWHEKVRAKIKPDHRRWTVLEVS